MSYPQRTLDIVSCQPVRTGYTKDGSEYTVYGVEARDPNTGGLINETLASFKEIPPGVGTFLLKPFQKRDGTTEYTLYDPANPPRERPAGGGGPNLGPKLGELEQRVAAIEQKIGYLTQAIGHGQQQPAAPAQQSFAPPAQQQAPAQTFGGPSIADTKPTADDDIPF